MSLAHWWALYIVIGCLWVLCRRPMEISKERTAQLYAKHAEAYTNVAFVIWTVFCVFAYPLVELTVLGARFLIWYRAQKLRAEETVLSLLTFFGEASGLDLCRYAERYAGGELRRSTIYILLSNMEEEGFLISREEPDEPPEYIGIKRRLYRVTEHGKLRFREIARQLRAR